MTMFRESGKELRIISILVPGVRSILATATIIRRRLAPRPRRRETAKKRQEAPLNYTAHFRITCSRSCFETGRDTY